MIEDRWEKDYDKVENLDDIIEARVDRDSAFSDDRDGMPDADPVYADVDPSVELGYPHHHKPSEDDLLALDVKLMDTPDRDTIEFDWQDNAEEMLPTDPEPSEGMGEDGTIRALGRVNPDDIVGPVPSVEAGEETDTAPAESEQDEYGLDGGEPTCPAERPAQLENAMDTDSDEADFSIEEKFEGEVPHETAEFEFEQMRAATERQEKKE